MVATVVATPFVYDRLRPFFLSTRLTKLLIIDRGKNSRRYPLEFVIRGSGVQIPPPAPENQLPIPFEPLSRNPTQGHRIASDSLAAWSWALTFRCVSILPAIFFSRGSDDEIAATPAPCRRAGSRSLGRLADRRADDCRRLEDGAAQDRTSARPSNWAWRPAQAGRSARPMQSRTSSRRPRAVSRP